ncbi:MAG: ABC transporter permease [Nitrososphaerales archaeon]
MRETWALTVRELKKWVRAPVWIVVSLMQPIVWILLFGNAFNPASLAGSSSSGALASAFGGAPNYLTFLTAGMFSFLLLYNSMFSGVSIVWDRTFGFLDKLLAAPIARSSIFLSLVAASLVKGVIVTLVLFGVALTLPNGLMLGPSFGALDFIALMAVLVVLNLGFSCAFIAIAVRTTDQGALAAIGSFIALPLLFASSALLPTSTMPGWMRDIVNVNPISKAADITRYLIVQPAMGGTVLSTVFYDAIYLIGFAALFVVVGLVVARRGLRMR